MTSIENDSDDGPPGLTAPPPQYPSLPPVQAFILQQFPQHLPTVSPVPPQTIFIRPPQAATAVVQDLSRHSDFVSAASLASCQRCVRHCRVIHGFHSLLGDRDFWRILSCEEEEEEGGEEQDPGTELTRHLMRVVIEATAFATDGKSQTHEFSRSCSAQQRALVHGVCEAFGFVAQAVGFHPKRRVIAAKGSMLDSPSQLPDLPSRRLSSWVKKAMAVKQVISSGEQREAKMFKSEKPPKKKTKKEDPESGGPIVLSSDSDEEKAEEEEEAKQTVRSVASKEVQTGPEETVDVETIRKAVSEEVTRFGHTIEGLRRAESEVCTRFHAYTFEELRRGPFLGFVQPVPERLSIPLPVLREFVAQSTSRDPDHIAASVVAQFGLSSVDRRVLVQRIDEFLRSTPASSSSSSSSSPPIVFIRALDNPPTSSAVVSSAELPLVVDAPVHFNQPRLDFIEQCLAMDPVGQPRFVCLDNGTVIRCGGGSIGGAAFQEAISSADPRRAVSELISVVVEYGGVSRVPCQLMASRAVDGFATCGEKRGQFMVEFVRLLPAPFVRLAPALIRSVVLEPFIDSGGTFSEAASADLPAISFISMCCGMSELHRISATTEKEQLPKVVRQRQPNPKDGGEEAAKVASVTTVEGKRELIEMIRKKEFGIGTTLGEEAAALAEVQHGRITRALERLSADLYARDEHFLLELLQNCDDSENCREATIVVTNESFVLHSDESPGFSESDIKAICDVGCSTKRGRQDRTGEKGIGFKSVFRVTRAPQIHSNGFHIEFDEKSKPVGFVVPRWIDGGAGGGGDDDDEPGTKIVLPWRKEISVKLREFCERIDGIESTALLFMRRISKIEIEDKVTQRRKVISVARNGSKSSISVNGEPAEEWLVFTKSLTPAVPRKGSDRSSLMTSTQMSLGFRVNAADGSASATDFHRVFSVLPLCRTGLRFALHCDLVSPAGREGIDEDSPWNQWLLSEVPDAFRDAVTSLLIPSSPSMRLTWTEFLPRPGDVATGFFSAVVPRIFRSLSSIRCIPIGGDLAFPHEAIVSSDSVSRFVFPNLRFVHPSFSSPPGGVLSMLGLRSLRHTDALSLLSDRTLSSRDDSWFSSLLILLSAMFDKADGGDKALQHLKQLSFIPISDGSVASCSPTPPVLFESSAPPFVRSVRRSVIDTIEPESVRHRVTDFLRDKLGIRHSTAHEVLHSFVLPSIQTPGAAPFVRDHWISCAACQVDAHLSSRLSTSLPIAVTSGGFRTAATGVHLKRDCIDSILEGLSHWDIALAADSDREFLRFVGVTEFIESSDEFSRIISDVSRCSDHEKRDRVLGRLCTAFQSADFARLPSALVSCLRTSKWIPSFPPCKRLWAPCELFDRSGCSAILGAIGPYPSTVLGRSFSDFLGIQNSVTGDALAFQVRRWASKKRLHSQITADQMSRVYSSLGPDRTKGLPIFVPKLGTFRDCSTVFWTDLSGLFVGLGGGYDESLKCVLGVADRPPVGAYLAALDSLSGTPTADAAAKAIDIFAHLGTFHATEVAGKLRTKSVFPTTELHWVSPREGIFLVADETDAEISKALPRAVKVIAIPADHPHRAAVVSLLHAVGINRISESATFDPITTGSATADNRIVESLRNGMPLIQRFLRHNHRELYDRLRADPAFLDRLESFTVARVDRLSGVWRVGGEKVASPTPQEALLACGKGASPRLFISSSESDSYPMGVLTEVAKLFIPKPSAALSHFLAALANRGVQSAEKLPGCGPELGKDESIWKIAERGADVTEDDGKGRESERGEKIVDIEVERLEKQQQQQQQQQQGQQAPEMFNSLGEEEKRAVGKWGEELVFGLLQKEFPHDGVTWVNEKTESGLPYDIVITDTSGKSPKRFVEVKTTKTTTKRLFEMSAREWLFAYEHRGTFSIYRVFGAFQPNVSVVRIQNPWEMWKDGSISMCISI